MIHYTSFWKKYRVFLMPTLVFIFIFAVFSYGAWLTYNYEIKIEQKKAADELDIISTRLETLINRQIDKTYALAVYSTSFSNLSKKELVAYSNKLFNSTDDILYSVIITDDFNINFAYPYESNKALIAKDISSIIASRKSIITAKLTQRIIISDPIKLSSGNNGILFSIPLFSQEDGINKDFIGILNVTLNLDRLFGKSGLLEATKTYDVNVIKSNAQSSQPINILFTQEKKIRQPIRLIISLPDNNWVLEAAPIGNWRPNALLHLVIFVSGLLIACIAFSYFRSLLLAKEKLNLMVRERTQALESSVETLRKTQEQLIQSEKQAALGELVAGVAHEINTPLGIGVTLTSHLLGYQKSLKRLYSENKLTKSELENYFAETEDALNVMDSSLNRAADIINSFKTVAIDQGTLESRRINMNQYIKDILTSLSSKLKGRDIEVQLICDERMEVTTYPGAISHILTNLILNSLIHGFAKDNGNCIEICISKEHNQIMLHYRDNGVGIAPSLQTKVFNPFYTTAKDRGGTGLGLHLVHNIVTQVLCGQITLESDVDQGVLFTIQFEEVSTPKRH